MILFTFQKNIYPLGFLKASCESSPKKSSGKENIHSHISDHGLHYKVGLQDARAHYKRRNQICIVMCLINVWVGSCFYFLITLAKHFFPSFPNSFCNSLILLPFLNLIAHRMEINYMLSNRVFQSTPTGFSHFRRLTNMIHPVHGAIGINLYMPNFAVSFLSCMCVNNTSSCK